MIRGNALGRPRSSWPEGKGPRVAAEVLEKIEAIVRLASTEQRVAKTGQAVLRMAAAVGTSDIAMLVGFNERTVRKCKKRFDGESPVDKLVDEQ